ncbi:MerR family transcriptional regulator [Lentzea sp. NPDC102401]|uniref:MerR family transcriptional regulator n=1 Tax=Lentzea sp. NPDC102401 TaxID=3364128 RepID=UPI003806D817
MTYTPRAVAAMLGIAPSTLRTWDHRYGLGPSLRSDGGHRRYRDADVQVLLRMVALTGQGISPAAAAELAHRETPSRPPKPERLLTDEEVTAAHHRFIIAAKRLDEPLMTDLAAKLVADHGVIPAWESVLAPCLVELGENIAESGSGIEVEHLASASVLQALRGVPRSARPDLLAALLSCAPDEQHVLALEALGAALSEQDLSWRNLGARVPAAALRNAVARLKPRITVIWAHHTDLAVQVPLEELHNLSGSILLVAGSGWQSTVLPPFAHRPVTLSEAVQLVATYARPER